MKAVAATAFRDQLTRMLVTRGATAAGLATAAQIARKVVLAIELAIAVGCSAYCGTVSFAQTMAELTVGLAQVIAATTKVLESTGGIVGGLASLAGEALARPVLLAWSMVNVENWDVGHLPPPAGPDMTEAGVFFSSEVQGETARRPHELAGAYRSSSTHLMSQTWCGRWFRSSARNAPSLARILCL